MKKHNRSNSLIYLLERTLRQLRHALHQEFRKNKVRISIDQWIILQCVSDSPGCSQQEIAEMTAKDPASVTRILRLLEKKKWVKRSVSEKDRRSVSSFISADGKKILTQCTKSAEQYRQKAMKGISRDELNQQREILDRLYENCR